MLPSTSYCTTCGESDEFRDKPQTGIVPMVSETPVRFFGNSFRISLLTFRDHCPTQHASIRI
jgi:hypothetical protein